MSEDDMLIAAMFLAYLAGCLIGAMFIEVRDGN